MREFLEAIWPMYGSWPTYGELRIIKDGVVDQQFHLLNSNGLEIAVNQAYRANQAGWDVYFGVLPRLRESGKAEDIADETTVLWADIDSKNRSKGEGFTALGRVSVPPAIIVDSGYGWHAYWLLSQAYHWEQARLAMKGIAKVVGGDVVYDKARILRVPETLNFKGDVPVPVRLVRFDPVGNAHLLSDFVEYIDIGADLERPVYTLSRVQLAGDRLVGRQIPDSIYRKMEEDPGKGARSEHVFSVVCSLLELGLSADEIEDRIRAHPQGVGVKYWEKGARGHDWLGYSIREAQRRVGW